MFSFFLSFFLFLHFAFSFLFLFPFPSSFSFSLLFSSSLFFLFSSFLFFSFFFLFFSFLISLLFSFPYLRKLPLLPSLPWSSTKYLSAAGSRRPGCPVGRAGAPRRSRASSPGITVGGQGRASSTCQRALKLQPAGTRDDSDPAARGGRAAARAYRGSAEGAEPGRVLPRNFGGGFSPRSPSLDFSWQKRAGGRRGVVAPGGTSCLRQVTRAARAPDPALPRITAPPRLWSGRAAAGSANPVRHRGPPPPARGEPWSPARPPTSATSSRSWGAKFPRAWRGRCAGRSTRAAQPPPPSPLAAPLRPPAGAAPPPSRVWRTNFASWGRRWWVARRRGSSEEALAALPTAAPPCPAPPCCRRGRPERLRGAAGPDLAVARCGPGTAVRPPGCEAARGREVLLGFWESDC